MRPFYTRFHGVFVILRLLVLCIVAIVPLRASGQTALSTPPSDSSVVLLRPKKSPKGAMLRSMLPGWGQLYNGQIIKGLLVVGGQGALIFNAVRLNGEAANVESGSLAHNYYIDRRNLMFWFMGGLTLLSMLDAYIDAHLYDFDTGPDLSIRVGPVNTDYNKSISGSTLGLTLHAKF